MMEKFSSAKLFSSPSTSEILVTKNPAKPINHVFSYTDFFAALDPGLGCVKIKNNRNRRYAYGI